METVTSLCDTIATVSHKYEELVKVIKMKRESVKWIDNDMQMRARNYYQTKHPKIKSLEDWNVFEDREMMLERTGTSLRTGTTHL